MFALPLPTLILVGVGVSACLFGNRGFWDLVRQFREIKHSQKLLTSLRAEHDRLTAELTRIQTDPRYTEYLIRKYLGYVKKGEVEYRILPPEKK